MNEPEEPLHKWKPAVPVHILLLTAGSLWFGTGVLLNAMAAGWLKNGPPSIAVAAVVAGLTGALFLHHFCFLRLARKNLCRILSMEGRRCFFSFVPWRNYFLVFGMIWMGYLFRHSAMPKSYLAILYICIGTALILSSCRYFKSFFRSNREKEPRGRNGLSRRDEEN